MLRNFIYFRQVPVQRRRQPAFEKGAGNRETTMKIRATAGLLALALTMIALPVQPGRCQEVTVITEESPPFNFVKDGRVTGSSTEVVREILRRLHQPDTIQVLPWARGYKMLQNRPDVALFSTTRTLEREGQFQWVGPLFTVHFGFYARRGADLRLNTLEDARRVGAIATYKDDVKEQLLKSLGFTNLDSSKSPASNLKKLMAGRVDLWLFDNLGMPDVAAQLGIDPADLELALPFRSYQSYVAFSRQTPAATVKKWQDTLDAMVADGTFGAISRAWLPEESIPDFSAGTAYVTGTPVLKIYTEDSPPGNYLENGRPTGLSVEVVREVLQRLRQPDTITVVPWARGYNLALSSPNVALFSTTRLPQREKLFQWVGPLYSQHWAFYAKKGSDIRIASLDEAKKISRIGTYLEDAKEQYLKRKGFTNLISANRNISNIRHLLSGDIDLWVSSDFNMPYQARQAGVDARQLELVYTFRRVDNFIAFSRGTAQDTVQAWQRCLKDIKRDGTYAVLCRKYDYTPQFGGARP
jgi:polar amino acid transport system substrate-binding protein